MPTFKQGNMWDVFNQVDHFVITTNSTLKQDGRLVMGAGVARTARDKFQGIDKALGELVGSICSSGGIYGFICTRKLCLLQVKRHFWQDADPDLMLRSLTSLANMAKQFPHRKFALNYPGIGKGNLTKEQVEPMLKQLPDNVQVWTFAKAPPRSFA